MTMLIPYDKYLNASQQGIINKPYREGRLGRAVAYAIEHPEKAFGVLFPANGIKKNIFAYAIAEGCLLGSLLDGLILAAPFIGKAGVTCCLANLGKIHIAALVVFESVVIAKNIHEISNSAAYNTWKNSRIILIKNNARLDFLRKDDILSHLFCPILKNIPEIPAKTSDNLTYDYYSAVQWIVSHPNTPLPGSQVISRVEDLTFDYAHINSVIVRLSNLAQILKEEKTRRIYSLLGVKNKQSQDELWPLLFAVEHCASQKFATLHQIFSKKDFRNIERLYRVINLVCKDQRNERINIFGEEYREIEAIMLNSSSPDTSETDSLREKSSESECLDEFKAIPEIENMPYASKSEITNYHIYRDCSLELYRKSSLRKEIYIQIRSPATEFFCNLFNIQPNVTIVRGFDPIVDSKLWGFSQMV